MTQKEIVYQHIRSRGEAWIPAYALRGVSTPWGFTGHSADRRARELAEAGRIERRLRNGLVEYRVPPARRTA